MYTIHHTYFNLSILCVSALCSVSLNTGCSSDEDIQTSMIWDMSEDFGEMWPDRIPCGADRRESLTCQASPLTPGMYCCPITAITCSCSILGGAIDVDGVCGSACHVDTGGEYGVDEHGCETYRDPSEGARCGLYGLDMN